MHYKKKNNLKKRQNTEFLIILAGFTLLFILFFSYQRNQNLKKLSALQNQEKILRKNITKKQEELNKKAEQEQFQSLSSNLQKSNRLYTIQKKIADNNKQLFDILLSYSDSSEYRQRANRTRTLLNSSVIRKSNIFKSDKIGDDGSFIDENGLHSEFKDCTSAISYQDKENVNVIILVTYESWFSGQRHGIAEDLYTGEFNVKTNKYSKLNRVNNIYMSRTNNDDD